MVDTTRQSRPRLVADNTQAHDAPDTQAPEALDTQAPEAPDFIAESLQRLYRRTEAEPLPSHLRALLDRLAAEDAAERVEEE